jgi:hypothetical protein
VREIVDCLSNLAVCCQIIKAFRTPSRLRDSIVRTLYGLLLVPIYKKHAGSPRRRYLVISRTLPECEGRWKRKVVPVFGTTVGSPHVRLLDK